MAIFHFDYPKMLFIILRAMIEKLIQGLYTHPPDTWETWVQPLGQEDPLEKGVATHSSTLAYKILRAEEPGRLQSIRVAKNWTRLKWLSIARTQSTVSPYNLVGAPSQSPEHCQWKFKPKSRWIWTEHINDLSIDHMSYVEATRK